MKLIIVFLIFLTSIFSSEFKIDTKYKIFGFTKKNNKFYFYQLRDGQKYYFYKEEGFPFYQGVNNNNFNNKYISFNSDEKNLDSAVFEKVIRNSEGNFNNFPFTYGSEKYSIINNKIVKTMAVHKVERQKYLANINNDKRIVKPKLKEWEPKKIVFIDSNQTVIKKINSHEGDFISHRVDSDRIIEMRNESIDILSSFEGKYFDEQKTAEEKQQIIIKNYFEAISDIQTNSEKLFEQETFIKKHKSNILNNINSIIEKQKTIHGYQKSKVRLKDFYTNKKDAFKNNLEIQASYKVYLFFSKKVKNKKNTIGTFFKDLKEELTTEFIKSSAGKKLSNTISTNNKIKETILSHKSIITTEVSSFSAEQSDYLYGYALYKTIPSSVIKDKNKSNSLEEEIYKKISERNISTEYENKIRNYYFSLNNEFNSSKQQNLYTDIKTLEINTTTEYENEIKKYFLDFHRIKLDSGSYSKEVKNLKKYLLRYQRILKDRVDLVSVNFATALNTLKIDKEIHLKNLANIDKKIDNEKKEIENIHKEIESQLQFYFEKLTEQYKTLNAIRKQKKTNAEKLNNPIISIYDFGKFMEDPDDTIGSTKKFLVGRFNNYLRTKRTALSRSMTVLFIQKDNNYSKQDNNHSKHSASTVANYLEYKDVYLKIVPDGPTMTALIKVDARLKNFNIDDLYKKYNIKTKCSSFKTYLNNQIQENWDGKDTIEKLVKDDKNKFKYYYKELHTQYSDKFKNINCDDFNNETSDTDKESSNDTDSNVEYVFVKDVTNYQNVLNKNPEYNLITCSDFNNAVENIKPLYTNYKFGIYYCKEENNVKYKSYGQGIGEYQEYADPVTDIIDLILKIRSN
ncbi:MAG: hypothetical protein U9N59_07280 [Campylobacterota bacterium]|nr:hypothetical protein [Campylobacterota bacterium]